MAESIAATGAMEWIKHPVLRSGKSLERSARRLLKGLHPSVVAHSLHWHLMSQDQVAAWTRDRLQLDGNYWLFVLGLNNSGTTLLVDLLKTHPRHALASQRRAISDYRPAVAAGLRRAAQIRGTARYFSLDRSQRSSAGATHPTRLGPALPAAPGILLEKSPPNTLRLRWFQHNFPPAGFLAITRHPYAVCEGIRRREGHSIEEAARHWTLANATLLDDITRLEHCLFITYEDLCACPRDYLMRLQAFLALEIPFDPKVLATPRSIHNIDGTSGLIRNFNERSLRELSARDIATIDRIAGPLMQRLGYAFGR